MNGSNDGVEEAATLGPGPEPLASSAAGRWLLECTDAVAAAVGIRPADVTESAGPRGACSDAALEPEAMEADGVPYEDCDRRSDPGVA